eukprot:maker-scaffold134_size322110-snap-gene-0.10 protein:Tk07173 transcript:maker-scaffold134_size322110-snap-gene-0.10-mRNA-1 annotation:"probable low-specificity l-threonine aldolase 2"
MCCCPEPSLCSGPSAEGFRRRFTTTFFGIWSMTRAARLFSKNLSQLMNSSTMGTTAPNKDRKRAGDNKEQDIAQASDWKCRADFWGQLLPLVENLVVDDWPPPAAQKHQIKMTGEALDVDMRSDTVTRPSQAMRQVMAEAEVGDAVFGDDLTTIELEAKAAELLGKEAGLFVPSGTMGNFLSVMAHCWGRGLEVLVGDKSHIYIYEQGNVSQFGGVHTRALANLSDGTFAIDELRSKIRPDDPHEPQTALVCIENTHNKCGGKVVPVEWIKQVGEACQELNLPLHCDGARIFNAAVALGVPVKELVQPCDSVSICLSKGLGAPIGSVVVGSQDFIRRVHRLRKAIGGGMRQSGILAAAGIFAFDNNVERMALDHERVKLLGKVFQDCGNGKFTFSDDGSNSNLLFISIDKDVCNAALLSERLKKIKDEEEKILGHATSIRGVPFSETQLRLSLHLDISEEMIGRAQDKIRYVLQEYTNTA